MTRLKYKITSAMAIILVPCGRTGQPACTICDFFVLIKNVINFLTYYIATPLAVVILIYGGIMMITSGGSEEKVKKGKNALSMAILGLVIVFAAWLIINTLLTWLVKPSVLKLFWPGASGC